MRILLKENKDKNRLNITRFIKFCIVGIIGVIPNYIVYNALRSIDFYAFNIFYFNAGWVFGILSGMTSNYILNELWTWSDK